MAESHLELLVEEPSMGDFLCALLPNLLPQGKTFQVHSFQGKQDLLKKLEARLRGYAAWLPDNYRVVVVVDRDNDDCHDLKQRLEDKAQRAGLRSKTHPGSGSPWQLVNRIVIEELEAWYFGDWEAVRAAYPRMSPNVIRGKRFRNPDAIVGGTWEAFEKVMQKRRYFKSGLRKTEAAREIGSHVDPGRNSSRSFTVFYQALMEAVQ